MHPSYKGRGRSPDGPGEPQDHDQAARYGEEEGECGGEAVGWPPVILRPPVPHHDVISSIAWSPCSAGST
jgi:hypothetical protein